MAVLPPDVPGLLLVPAPELFSFISPEPPLVVPAQALNSMAQAMGIIHLVINHSRKDKKAVRTNNVPEDCMNMQSVEAGLIVKVRDTAGGIEFTQGESPCVMHIRQTD